jgi:1-acyl-sn-glycerol-3-phosphate acyltransferase
MSVDSRRRAWAVFHTLTFYVPYALNGIIFLLTLFVPMWLLSRLFPVVLVPLFTYTRWFYRLLMRLLTLAGAIRIMPIEGVERLRQGGPMVVVANHRTMLDVLILMSQIPRATCLVKPLKSADGSGSRSTMPDFWKPFILGPFHLLGYIPMPADWSNRAALRETFERCRQVLHDGRPLVLFPEGTRSPDGHLLPFRDFPFHLALAAGVPVVPVAIHTQVRFMPQGSVSIDSPQRCVFRMKVLPEIRPARGLRSPDISIEVRRRIQKYLAEHNQKYGYRG